MSRVPAVLAFALCLMVSGCGRPQYQPVDCDCGQVSAAAAVEFRAARDSPAPGYSPMPLTSHGMSQTVFVSDSVGLSFADVATVNTFWIAGGKPALSLGFTPSGATRMKALSQAQMGQRLAFLLDGRLVQAGMVVAEIGDTAIITGSLTPSECCAVTCAFRIRQGSDGPGT